MTVRQWCDEQDPTTIPFRPRAAHTQGFGLRVSLIASPAHLGGDRGGVPSTVVMPWDEGTAEWTMLPSGRAWGSFLRIYPDSSPFGVEIHVGHTMASDGVHPMSWSGRYRRGETLPCYASTLGVGSGAHTHAELVVEYSRERVDELRAASSRWIVRRGLVSQDAVEDHCAGYGFDPDHWMDRLEVQSQLWGIEELTDVFAVRRGTALTFPEYRVPRWGRGPVLLVDPRWALQI